MIMLKDENMQANMNQTGIFLVIIIVNDILSILTNMLTFTWLAKAEKPVNNMQAIKVKFLLYFQLNFLIFFF